MKPANLTIGIPTLNRGALVAELVRSCLSQTRLPLRIVVSDNASEDDTAERLGKLSHESLKVVRQSRNIGMVGNWNACLQEAEGDWFVLLSDDDLIDPDFVASVESAVAAAPDADLLIMRCRVLDRSTGEKEENSPPVWSRGNVEVFDEIIPAWLDGRFTLPFAGMIFRRSTLEARGGFSDALPFAADVATWLPIAADGQCAFWPDAKVTYVLHNSMTTWTFPITKLVQDIVSIEELLLREIAKSTRLSDETKARVRALSRGHVYKSFGNIMIQTARRGARKRNLLRAWVQYASRLPLFGFSPLSVGALLVPSRLIPLVGAPYRAFIGWQERRHSARAAGAS